ncbi:MAG: ribulose-phosphate 3-epimerase [bacterium]
MFKTRIQLRNRRESEDHMRKIEIVPSVLSADFSRLGEQIKKVEKAGCSMLHLDVMDGHFVPNITFGPVVIKDIRKSTKLYLESHLMIENPEKYIQDFRDAGSDCIIIHQEACSDFLATVAKIKDLGMQAGVALRPKTPVSTIKDVIGEVDTVLIMSVEPGFGGQSYIEGSERKIVEVKALIDKGGLDINIGVDGGINEKTIPAVVAAGANLLIAGNAAFKGNLMKNIKILQDAIKSS